MQEGGAAWEGWLAKEAPQRNGLSVLPKAVGLGCHLRGLS